MARKYFEVILSGFYSFAYNWDDGLRVESVREVTDNDILEWNDMHRRYGVGYWIDRRRFDLKNDDFTPVQIKDGGGHGGSRIYYVIVVAKNANRAKAIAQKWADKNWKRY